MAPVGEGEFGSVVSKHVDDLPPGEVLIKVRYSSLNYKDALSASGHRGITRSYPHVPGIDAAGIVEKSADPHFKKGDKVIVTGYDLGVNTSGAFAEYIRVPASWPVHLPNGLSRRRSMMFGTAGFTAALAIHKLITNGIAPPNGKVVVTGASGGVGVIAVAILAHLGYQVTAVSGKPEMEHVLKDLGAWEVIPRESLDDQSDKAFLKSQYAAAIDTTGGNMLSTILKSMQYGGIVTACGMVGSADLHTTVYPFILKGVHLLGVESAFCNHQLRQQIWAKLASSWMPAKMDKVVSFCTLHDLNKLIATMLQGRLSGRYVIDTGA